MSITFVPRSDSTPLVADRLAFGVDPTRPERYSLRQGRYQAIGDVLAQESQRFVDAGTRLKLLDVGVWNGISMRYIEPRVPDHQIEYHGVDLKLHAGIYRRTDWASLQEGNLLDGMPHIPSETFDVLICEQVVEHLPTIDVALQTLSRVVKPGGLLILGVPIFPSGVHLLRKHLVPAMDKLVGTKKVRGHLQAFSRASFERAILKNCDVEILASRGFRMISGGLLRSLENQHWWWRLNRQLGYTLPGLCTEIQVVARKRGTASETALPLARAA